VTIVSNVESGHHVPEAIISFVLRVRCCGCAAAGVLLRVPF
jgi:hypothetical protein